MKAPRCNRTEIPEGLRTHLRGTLDARIIPTDVDAHPREVRRAETGLTGPRSVRIREPAVPIAGRLNLATMHC